MSKQVLRLLFMDNQNSKKVITIQHPKKNLTKEVVRAAMDSIVASKAIGEGNWQLYADVVGAEYYTTQTDQVFTSDNDE